MQCRVLNSHKIYAKNSQVSRQSSGRVVVQTERNSHGYHGRSFAGKKGKEVWFFMILVVSIKSFCASKLGDF